MTHSWLLAAFRLAVFLTVTGSLVPVYLALYSFGRWTRRGPPYLFHRLCLSLTGLTIVATGRQQADDDRRRGILFVANHASYLDIPVLAAQRDGLFVAKAEVRGWPVIGWLATLVGTLFITRRATHVPQERLRIARRLARGQSIFLFPEGSSSDGTAVLPFRPGLLSAALVDERQCVAVQPVSIVYGPAIGTQPSLPQGARDRYAWYGDMELAPHLWRLFGMRGRTVVAVQFHAPRAANEFANPKLLAEWAERTVADGVRTMLDHGFGSPRFVPGAAAPPPFWEHSARLLEIWGVLD